MDGRDNMYKFTVQSFLLLYYNIIYNINREYISELDKY